MGSMSGDEFTEKLQDVGERILVSVRLRPLNGKEIARNDVSDWEGINDNTLIYRNAGTERSMYPSAYTFDRVFGCDSPTKKVYKEAAKEVALSVVSGINASIFAYGQTSSGKTYTMSGITEFAVEDIYEYIQRHDERTFVLKFSAMEIYNEAVRDLLSTDNTPLRLLDDPERGTVVDKLTEEPLRDLDHLKELLELCEAQRQIGETSLNEMSSRSHQILRLSIESSTREFMGKDNCSTLAASVDFVDLAGSERASQTLSAGARLKEGCHINRSLLTLGTVVRKLSKGRNGHVPYRDSKLTRILQCSLGGNARTAIICTISPARSHVEQSRNTLSFASCAKEVATSAQVNVVMSDKALVKHLQRELTRLESELGGLGSSSSTSGSAALLKEKDLQIEKMEKEIKELILQRDLALSRLDNLEQAGDDRELVEESSRYPQLRAPPTDESASSAVADRRFLNAGVKKSGRSHFSNGFIRSRSNEHPKQFPEDHFLFDVSSPQFSTISPKFVGPDPYKGWEQGGRDDFEELCKDVRCIELEESAIKKTAMSCTFTHEEGEGMLPLTRSEDGTTKDQGFVSSPQKVDEDSDKVDAKFTYGEVEQEFQDVQKIIDCVPGEDLSSSRSLNLTRASSCDSAMVTGSSFPSDKADKNGGTPSSGSEKDVSGKPQHIRRSSFNCIPKSSSMSRENSFTSERSNLTDDLKSHGIKNPTQDDVTSIHTFVSGLNEMTKLHCENKLDENQDQEKEPRTRGSEKTVKDVGLDPMQDSPLNWQLEFEGQQKEIIELWQTCHVSLIHRTYFFLLFKGDPSDSIYMEVERRRLSFLKDLYSRGNFDKIPVEGVPDLTPASSMKALRREREMLAKQMQKRLPEEEREKLYEKWGIGLKTKQRRLQLARRVWTDTKDMNHIRESASLVANLLGLLEPKQGVKEMFILNFTPQKINRRSYSWKSS